MSGEVVLMTLAGDMGTLFGPMAGATIMTSMKNHLGQLGAWATIVHRVSFVVRVLVLRRGVVGEIAHWLKKPP